MRFLCAIAFINVSVLTLDAQDTASPLNWTASDGRALQAHFVQLSQDAVIVIKDGKKWTLPFANLTEESVKRAKHCAAERARASDFVLIPEGVFKMGDQASPPVGEPVELPVHSVRVSAFYMGKHEVTKGLWNEVRAWGIKHGYKELPEGEGKAADHPVNGIRWAAAVGWCNARSEMEGLEPCYKGEWRRNVNEARGGLATCDWNANGYRLPSEAEWEKAARGGLEGKNFPWGDVIRPDQANYIPGRRYAYEIETVEGYRPRYGRKTSPVGNFAPNEYGLFDVAGNVSEMCWDCWEPKSGYPPEDTENPPIDPHGPQQYASHIVRGGGFRLGAFRSRVASRDFSNGGLETVGFRLARNADTKPAKTNVKAQ